MSNCNQFFVNCDQFFNNCCNCCPQHNICNPLCISYTITNAPQSCFNCCGINQFRLISSTCCDIAPNIALIIPNNSHQFQIMSYSCCDIVPSVTPVTSDYSSCFNLADDNKLQIGDSASCHCTGPSRIMIIPSVSCFNCCGLNEFQLISHSCCDIIASTIVIAPNPLHQFQLISYTCCDIVPSIIPITSDYSSCFNGNSINELEIQESSDCYCDIYPSNIVIHLDLTPINCVLTACLTTSGGSGCGVEYINGVIYSVCSQFIDVTVSDDSCVCLDNPPFLINGDVPPVFVTDGGIIDIEVQIKSSCEIGSTTKKCTLSAFTLRKTRSGYKLIINKALLRRIRK